MASTVPIADCRLYGFIDTAYLAGRDPAHLTAALVEGGVDVIQVRAKQATTAERIALARTVVDVAAARGVLVIVNDDIDAAVAAGADGVHLGQEDWAELSAEQRTTRLAPLRVVGISTHSLAQARQAEEDGADYIGVGPVFATDTKPGVAPVGLELVRQAAAAIRIPFFAIGGITLERLERVRAAGATRVAVVSAILAAPDLTVATRAFKQRLSG